MNTIAVMDEVAKSYGVEILTETTATALLQEDGKVIGVQAESADGEVINFEATDKTPKIRLLPKSNLGCYYEAVTTNLCCSEIISLRSPVKQIVEIPFRRQFVLLRSCGNHRRYQTML